MGLCAQICFIGYLEGREGPNISPFLSFLKARIGVLTCSQGYFFLSLSLTEIHTPGFGFCFLFL